MSTRSGGSTPCRPLFFFIAFLSALSLLFTGCESKSREAGGKVDSKAALVARGQTVYQANCIACHNADPRKPGAVGPDVFGSSRELLEARVLRSQYPAGYQPKRKTKMMAALPHLQGEIEALHEYLNRLPQ